MHATVELLFCYEAMLEYYNSIINDFVSWETWTEMDKRQEVNKIYVKDIEWMNEYAT